MTADQRLQAARRSGSTIRPPTISSGRSCSSRSRRSSGRRPSPLEQPQSASAREPHAARHLALRALVTHLAEQRPMMGAFLDALGIAHENGLIQDDAVAPTRRRSARPPRRSPTVPGRECLPCISTRCLPPSSDVGRPRRCPAEASLVSHAVASASGRNTSNVVPRPGGLLRVTVPPASLAMPYTIDSPRPLPFDGSLVVKNGSNTRRCRSGSIPAPQSWTEMRA